MRIECPDCKGEGYSEVHNRDCRTCKGKEYVDRDPEDIIDDDQEDEEMPDIFCLWIKIDDDYYEVVYKTGCGDMAFFVDGDIQSNHFQYCPFCGEVIKEVRE
jgi:RecJ-like exonuclease